ncbi:uncharacterized protein LOC112056141 isoform X2 [Bicyclus anynana]|uniref:Uncharacterized protein LOC112056141 isoform X2 n=1 Tax=Bicyclus anynana TaxID=110368 RepID=A0ABM3M319_BICAN|nr:uncharacterized protein LOC112056141 isoform X2 [Bicyclus anynana]
MEILDTRKMQCCVPFCKTTSKNVMTTAKGTTFHEVPSEEHLRTAWLRALSIQEHDLPDPAVVCSQHFLDDDFYETNSCVRQIRSNAIPSTVQMCMICLDTGSKLVLMTKHRLLQEAYDQLTGLSLFQLCRGGNLKQTLCVMCAQRLINFSGFRDLGLRAHSLLTDLVEQHELITLQHKEVMNKAAKHSMFNLTQTTLSANHCDLYINHTDEEQPPAEESVVVKIEDMSESIMISDHLLVKDEYKGDNYKYCVSIDDCSASIKVETHSPDDVNVKVPDKAAVSSTAVAVHVPRVQDRMKSESVTFGCTLCVEDFVEENTYNEHMSKHLKDAGSNTACDASQVCEPRAAVSRSGDSLVLQNKTGSQRLSDESPPAAGCAPAVVSPLSASVEANKKKSAKLDIKKNTIKISIFEAY